MRASPVPLVDLVYLVHLVRFVQPNTRDRTNEQIKQGDFPAFREPAPNRIPPLQDAQKDRPARPQQVKARGVPIGYVEGLNDARTLLAVFFSILIRCLGSASQSEDSQQR
jgi:hypothetical protein